MKVYLHSLGCPKNQVDAEVMLRSLLDAGHERVLSPEGAEIIIVNTCGFIEAAKVESVDAILALAQYKERPPHPKLIMTGCLSQRYSDEILADLPEVDAVLGVTQYPRIAEYIERVAGARAPLCDVAFHADVVGGGGRELLSPSHTAYLKIAEGCNNRCTYCAIPMIRGPYRSRPLDDLVNEAKTLAKGGTRELILAAQDTTRYGIDLYGRPSLVKLLTALCAVEGLTWIRVLYTYPELVDDDLLALIESQPKLCAYLDVPLQHIDDGILRAMGRRIGEQGIRDLFSRIRKTRRYIALRTTMIVGFPGESEQAFEKLLDFISDHPFDHLGAFAYSPEEGTPAQAMEGQIPRAVKQRRLDRLMMAQQQVLRTLNRRHIGQEYNVLVEGEDGPGRFRGRSEYQAPDIDSAVLFSSDRPLAAGDWVRVRITDVSEYDWMGVALP